MSENTSSQNNSALTNILAGFSGSMAVVFETVSQYGGPVGKKVGAIYNVVNGVIEGVIEYYGEPAASDMERLEKAAVGMAAGTVAGIVVAELLPVGAIAVVGAGITAVLVQEGSDLIYDGYKWMQEKTFWLLDKFPDGIFSPDIDGSRSIFTTASTTAQRRDPIFTDLNGDGVKTIGVDAGAYFDHDANGFAEQTGWVSPDDGLLVRDINNDGIINNGRELFGDNTLLKNGSLATDGLQALADLDSNGDNKIDSADSAFSQLKVWKDANSDGISTADELKTLSDLGIKSLNTTYTVTNITDSTGNTQTHQATYACKKAFGGEFLTEHLLLANV